MPGIAGTRLKMQRTAGKALGACQVMLCFSKLSMLSHMSVDDVLEFGHARHMSSDDVFEFEHPEHMSIDDLCSPEHAQIPKNAHTC